VSASVTPLRTGPINGSYRFLFWPSFMYLLGDLNCEHPEKTPKWSIKDFKNHPEKDRNGHTDLNAYCRHQPFFAFNKVRPQHAAGSSAPLLSACVLVVLWVSGVRVSSPHDGLDPQPEAVSKPFAPTWMLLEMVPQRRQRPDRGRGRLDGLGCPMYSSKPTSRSKASFHSLSRPRGSTKKPLPIRFSRL